MKHQFRAALAALVAGSVVALVAPTAQALPTTPVAPPPVVAKAEGPPLRDDNWQTAAQNKDISATVNIRNHAYTKKSKTLNYKKANEYDKGRTGARRGFARGVIAGGGKVTKISKAERAKVMKIKVKTLKHESKRTTAADTSAKRAVNCKGRNDTVAKKSTPPAFDVYYYYDSCRTESLISAVTNIGLVGGLLSAIGVEAVGPPLIVLCGIGVSQLNKYKNQSDIKAVYVRDHNHLLSGGPQ